MDEESLRRHFVAVATADYKDETWRTLSGVRDEVQALQRWLCAEDLGSRRFKPCYPELADNPSLEQIQARLQTLAAGEVWRDADAAVLFVTGHGVLANSTHYLVLHESQATRLSSTAVRTSDLIAWLIDTNVQHMLIIVDACYAGAVAAEVLNLDKQPPPQWLVLPGAAKDQKAGVGALTRAITEFLTFLGTAEGEKYGRQEYLGVDVFLEAVQERLKGQKPIALQRGRADQHVCLPNPHYRRDEAVEVGDARHDLALPRQDLETHWGPRARGVASDDQPGWLFTGRAALMRKLIAATTAEPAATVVTGGAGSGKSAALARLVTLSDQRFLDQHVDDVAAIPADLRPAPGAVDAAVVATGKLHTQVLAQLCHALQVPAPPSSHAEPTIEERLTAWHSWLAHRQRPVTIVVDALDEAAHPHTLIREVLARLEPDPQRPRIRLLVGVRSLAAGEKPTGDSATSSAGGALADLTEAVLHAGRIRVDEAPWWDQDDVVAYVDSILRHTPGSPYPHTATTTAVAAALGHRAGRSFLIARIAASSLADRDTVITADNPGWLAALDEGVLGVFRQDLHQSLPEPADRHRAVILLRAVAFAYGAGLPWRKIWPRVAHAVDDDGGDYGDSDIAWLLGSRLSAYLVTDTEDDTTVYRLFHDLLRATLRERWRELLQPPTS